MDVKGNYGINSFKAVKLSPRPEDWDQKVLSAVLNSEKINNIVKKDAKNGVDTSIDFYTVYDPPYPECPAHRNAFLNVKGGEDAISLETRSYYWFIPGHFLRSPIEIQVGPEDIYGNLTNKIKKLDDNPEKPSHEKTLDDLRKIASKIIYEDAKPIE